MSWMTIVHLVIYNLMRRQDIESMKIQERDHKFFRWKEDVCAFIEEHWQYLAPDKPRSLTWHNTIASVLSTHSTIFQSGFEKFHQSAWWTLKKEAPPVQENKPKVIKLKPNLKKPLKRARNENESEEQPTDRKLRRRPPSSSQLLPDSLDSIQSSTKEDIKPEINIKIEDCEIKEEDNNDNPLYGFRSADYNSVFDLSSLSELSCDSDILSQTDDIRKNEDHPGKNTIEDKKKATDLWVDSIKKEYIKPEIELEEIREASPPIEEDSKAQPEKIILKDLKEITQPEADIIEITKLTAHKVTTMQIIEIDHPSKDKINEEVELPIYKMDIEHNIQDKEDKNDGKKESNLAPRIPPTPTVLSQQEEWQLLQKFDNNTQNLPANVARYRRKLNVRRLKRNLGLKIFDIDSHVAQHIRQKRELSPMSKESQINTSHPAPVKESNTVQTTVESITYTPYASSFASRLYGMPRHRSTFTRDEPWLSSWNGRKLRPYIRRDFESRPDRMRLLKQIKDCAGRPMSKDKQRQGQGQVEENESIDYVYFQHQHLAQANIMLCRCFWDDIDVSESLMFPEFSIVALYRKCVIGCAFMTPEAYITYVAVLPGWESAGIGQFMLYHLFQTAISKDITLHVSANNNAMILYQKFGFKPEEFIVNFYDKYLPSTSELSKNAFLLRLRR
ncbi:hypothetical protein BDF14DRAFT_1877358 [Spinellus fusiger]|nr:hypothetical protein BDF14DRAFT_1877358 [Spinellus fusiger]